MGELLEIEVSIGHNLVCMRQYFGLFGEVSGSLTYLEVWVNFSTMVPHRHFEQAHDFPVSARSIPPHA
ncbi:hypothetical protein MTR_3g111260 [Medicago truncatula]|uniref:Uncharacterized protein n=1 Tax=Medicago truncatula TaxID=3880 RepID=G7J448_MEDTR|nr:hypothetical protein MTR_3g111260 [Medicago truncatula]